MNRARASLVLPWRFVLGVVSGGLHTARRILRLGGVAPQPGYVRVSHAPLTPTGCALLAALVTLTPGTTVIDVDPRRHRLLLHMLDHSQREATVAAIRRDFEPALVAWFGQGTTA